jgi:hypothetical protein
MLQKVPGADAMRSWPYLVAKPSHVGGGGDVDRASHPLWRPSSVSVSLSCRVSGLGRFLLAWPLSLPWEELLPLWTRTRVRQTGAHDS